MEHGSAGKLLRGCGGLELFARETEAALAATILGDGGGQISFGEIGPEGRGENEFSVGGLEQEEITDAGFARGADDEVRVRQVGGREVAAEGGVGGVVEWLFSGGDGGSIGAGGIDDLGAGAVIEREDEGVVCKVLGGFNRGAEDFLDTGGKLVRATDGAEADAVADEGVEFLLQVILQEAHETADFVLGAFPVFDRESVEGEHFHAEVPGGEGGGADGLDAATVALDAGQAAGFRPASVAVHNDGDVVRDGDRRGRLAHA